MSRSQKTRPLPREVKDIQVEIFFHPLPTSDPLTQQEDVWEIPGQLDVDALVVIRHIRVPRRTMFSPMESPNDLPQGLQMQRIDVYRETTTTLPFADEAKIEDFWNGTDADNRPCLLYTSPSPRD